MKLKGLIGGCLAVAIFVLAACSSDDSSASGGSCSEAKKVADQCKSQPSDGGAKITVDFDEGKCNSAGDQGKKAADCIVANKSRCDCLLACSLQGSCP